MPFSEPRNTLQRRLRIVVIGVATAPTWLLEFDVIAPVAIDAPDASRPDVYVIDASDHDHRGLVATLAARGYPVVVVGRDDPAELTQYLDAGASDYLTVHSRDEECIARVRALSRFIDAAERGPGADGVRIGEVWISLKAHDVRRSGMRVNLTPNQFRVLAVLLEHRDEIVTYRAISRELWDEEPKAWRQYIRNHVSRIRQLLEANPDQPTLVINERGVGYRLQSNGLADRESA